MELPLCDYLCGQGSLNDICETYGIRAIRKIGKWSKQYMC